MGARPSRRIVSCSEAVYPTEQKKAVDEVQETNEQGPLSPSNKSKDKINSAKELAQIEAKNAFEEDETDPQVIYRKKKE